MHMIFLHSVSVITDNLFNVCLSLPGSYSFFCASDKCLSISKVPTKFCVIKGNPIGMLVTGAAGGYLRYPVGSLLKNNLYR